MVADSGGGSTTSGSDADSRTGENSATSDVQVEIQGIIYIYNPPDRAKLGTGAVGERLGIDQAGDAGVEAAAAGGRRAQRPQRRPAAPRRPLARTRGTAPGSGTSRRG